MRPNMRLVNGMKAKLFQRIKAVNSSLYNDLTELALPWYTIRNLAPAQGSDESTTEIFIYEEIGGSFGMSADQFVADLQEVETDNILVRINSPGGDVFDAIAIYNALLQHPANVMTRVDSLAASAASIIAMAGAKLEMMPGSQLMIHDAMSPTTGNPAELRELAKFLDLQSDNLASIYAERGGSETNWRAMMTAETWMFAEEAVGFGLADSVYTRKVRQAIEEEEVQLDPDSDVEEEEASEDGEASAESDEDKEDAAVNAALAALMNRKHRTANRGYKYTSRDSAPDPKVQATKRPEIKATKHAIPRSLADAYLERISNGR